MPRILKYRGVTIPRGTTAKQMRARTRRPRRRRVGSARPKRALSVGYKGPPNQYRYVRETRPTVIDLGDGATPGVTLVAGTGAIPNISIFEFPNFSIDQLAGGFTQFNALYANYRIDKIETILIPMWSSMTQQPVNPLNGAWTGTATTPNLMMTRVNTKFLSGGYTVPATAELNRDQLAQIQKKTRSLYGNKKWLSINTTNPRVEIDINDGSGGTNTMSAPMPWLSCETAADQEYQMNDILFADRLDGTDFVAGIHKYRMYHRIHFRCSFAG